MKVNYNISNFCYGRMLKNVSLCVLTVILLLFSQYYTDGLKCELKGFVNNRVQCVLHDRGISPEDAGMNGTVSLVKQMRRERPGEDLWKFTGGIDANRTFFPGEKADDFKRHVRAHIPGTRWCGDSDRDPTMSYDDLNLFVRTDQCCKSHDACVLVIEGKESKYELKNNGIMRRFHCDCEMEFWECLKNAQGVLANKIGFTYFTVFGPQCFLYDYPQVNCTKRKMTRCVEYGYNKTEEKKYQWFDNMPY